MATRPDSLALKVKKLVPHAILPRRAHPGDAGLDLHAAADVEIPPHQARLVPTGIAVELPPGTEAQVRPRSGLALKHMVTVLNAPGTIDEGYRGEIAVLLINHGAFPFSISRGMRIAQLVVQPVLAVEVAEVCDLNTTSRNAGGFGSSGLSARSSAHAGDGLSAGDEPDG